MEIISFGNKDYKKLKKFVRFPNIIYKNYVKYVPPLDMNLLGNKILGTKGILTDKHPFHKKAKVKYWMVVNNNKVLGRIAGCINRYFIERQKENTGFFGFFESINDKIVSDMLFDTCIKWLKSNNITCIKGPINFDTTDNIGLLIEGFNEHHYMMTSYNPEY